MKILKLTISLIASTLIATAANADCLDTLNATQWQTKGYQPVKQDVYSLIFNTSNRANTTVTHQDKATDPAQTMQVYMTCISPSQFTLVALENYGRSVLTGTLSNGNQTMHMTGHETTFRHHGVPETHSMDMMLNRLH